MPIKTFSDFINEADIFKDKENELKKKFSSLLSANAIKIANDTLKKYSVYDSYTNRVKFFVYPYKQDNNSSFLSFVSVYVNYMFFDENDKTKFNIPADTDLNYYNTMLQTSNNNTLKGNSSSKYGKDGLTIEYVLSYDLENNDMIIISECGNENANYYDEVLMKFSKSKYNNSINFDEISNSASEIAKNFERYLSNFIRKDAESYKKW
jgi:hypothetical protein